MSAGYIIAGIVLGVVLGIVFALGITLYSIAKTNSVGERKGRAKDFSRNTNVIFHDGDVWRSSGY